MDRIFWKEELWNYPRIVEDKEKELPTVYKSVYTALENTDVYFLMNEKKNGINGYVGASAELTFRGKVWNFYILKKLGKTNMK